MFQIWGDKTMSHMRILTVAAVLCVIAQSASAQAPTPPVKMLGFGLYRDNSQQIKVIGNTASRTCSTGSKIISGSCSLDSGVGHLQNIGPEGDDTWSCNWNDVSGTFKPNVLLVCLKLD